MEINNLKKDTLEAKVYASTLKQINLALASVRSGARCLGFAVALLIIIPKMTYASYSDYMKSTTTRISFSTLASGQTQMTFEMIDRNKVSIISSTTHTLPKFSGNVHFHHCGYTFAEKPSVIVKDDHAYYTLDFVDREYIVNPIATIEEVKHASATLFIFHSGQVRKLQYEEGKPTWEEFPRINGEFEVVASTGYSYMLRTPDCFMWTDFSNSENSERIDIDPKSAVYYIAEAEMHVDQQLLYDDTRFYIIRKSFLHTIDEITDQIALFNKREGFLKWRLRHNPEYGFYEVLFEEAEAGTLWVYIPDGITLYNNQTVYLYPVPGRIVSQDQSIIEYNGKYFSSGSNLRWYRFLMRSIQQESGSNDSCAMAEAIASAEQLTIDISEVADVTRLRRITNDFYTDSIAYYYKEYDDNYKCTIHRIEGLSPNAIYYPGITYGTRSSPEFFHDPDMNGGDTIVSLGGVAYLLGDSMMIENRMIPSMLDAATAILVESTAQAIYTSKETYDEMVFDDSVVEGESEYSFVEVDYEDSAAEVVESDDSIAEVDYDDGVVEVTYRHLFRDCNGTYIYTTESGKLIRFSDEATSPAAPNNSTNTKQ